MIRNIRDKVIVITGASSGIGAATAVACAQAGMDVVVAARRRERLMGVAQKVEQQGRRALPIVCDVNEDKDVNHLMDQTVSVFGRLDGLFANAGGGLIAPVMETTDQMMRDLFETNFFGTLRCVRAAVLAMRRQASGTKGCHILICSSCVSEIALPEYGAYCATKAAQDSIAQSLRAELTHEGIYVSSVHPVTTDTEFFDRSTQRSPDALNKRIPHQFILQSADHVASHIVRCLRKPHPEVWPHLWTRFGVAICTAFPRLAAWAMDRIRRRSTCQLAGQRA